MPLINRYTGQEATPKQLEACRRHAERILASPYSAPEQVQWAIEVPGVDIDGWFWESSQQRGSVRAGRPLSPRRSPTCPKEE